MRLFCQFVAAALVFAPAVASSQEEARAGHKQKAWLTSNFRSGLACSSVENDILSFTGRASFDASGKGGIEVTVTRGPRAAPTVTAHAINTKGTGAAGRAPASVSACPAVKPGDATACTLSGDAESPTVSASIPVSVFGDAQASRYIGTVTIVKRSEADVTSPGPGNAKKGYDYYQAQSQLAAAAAQVNPSLRYLATCDSSALSSKGSKPSLASYDLAVAKK